MILKKYDPPMLVSIQKIWDHAPHNAMTDLIRFQNTWYCTFRESNKHVKGSDGKIRILTSQDSVIWSTAAIFTEDGIDLRDPKLSITPDGRLMLLMGGTEYSPEHTYISRQPRISFSTDGVKWTKQTKILEPHEWLWRVTWYHGRAYGVSYRYSDPTDRYAEWLVNLFQSDDGIHYEKITPLAVEGYPNEATIHFNEAGEMIMLLRRDDPNDSSAYIGVSSPPYVEWNWVSTKRYFGGPNFIVLPSGKMWAAGRLLFKTPYITLEKTALARMAQESLKPTLILPSGGDTSYPGMVYHQGYLWVSYYSSHELNTAIYLAKLQLPVE